MRFPPHLLDEIRARLPVSTVVGRKVRLKKAGREWKGLSPFNAEKTPSFYVNDQKGFYHCFSSGKHGDIFTFLMETEGLSFPEAVERLAAEAGVDLPKASPEAARQEARARGLHEVVELAAAWFEAALAGRAGRAARDYLERRGIDEELRRTFRIGYAPPERYGLRDHLAGQGVAADAMAEAGLLVTGPEIAVPYDRFRDRVMFPIADLRGRIVAFGGRAMSADVPAKYLNSPETPLFSKGRLLYNFHRARPAAQEAGTLVAVEGYVDAIALHSAGYANVVAPLGTALTEDQLALLWRAADEPILCFDGDKAGRRAAYRAVDVALPILPPGKSLRFALLPEGQDPDDLVRAGGRAAVAAALDAARPLAEILWMREAEAGPADTPERKADQARRLREAVAQIRDETLRRFYRDDIETRLAAGRRRPEAWTRRDGGAWRGRSGAEARGGPPGERRLTISPALASRLGLDGLSSPREALIVAALFAQPHLLHAQADALAALEIAERDARALRDVLLDCALHDDACEEAVLTARAERAGLAPALARMRERVRPGDRWALEPGADPLRLAEVLRQAFTLQRRSRTLHGELRAAERALAADDSDTNLVWLREVQAELQSIDGAEAETGAT
ncbi:MAG: DNA primase [Methylobacteriaceae bacterium]|nr:DNA primase [Methylobacteriaceae bacterium]